jgi:predicted nucleic acid-binding protein
LREIDPVELTASEWTRVEFYSVLAREVRMESLDAPDALEACSRFETLLAGSFKIVLPDRPDFGLCAEFLSRFDTGLRAGDALHLAIAANRSASAIYTLDKGLVSAGKILGLPVRSGIRAR